MQFPRVVSRLALCALLALAPALSLAAPPSDAEINRLLAASRAQAMLTTMQQQVEAMQDQQFEQLLANTSVTAEQRQQVQQLAARTRQTMRQAMAWPVLRKIYLEQYKQHFSREDVVAMAEFYESDAGQRMLDKTPELMASTMNALQQQLAPEMERLQRDLEAIASQPAR